MAYPDATLIAVDYSIGSTGIHYDCFDHVWLQRPWNELNLDLYASQIPQLLGGESYWISCLDLEVQWLAQQCPQEPNTLVPSFSVMRQTVKPTIPAARKGLPVCIPDSIPTTRPAWELYDFCRKHGWPVWCKGPNYEARSCDNWREVLEAISELEETWATSNLSLQANVPGQEEAVVFCAYKGALLDCTHLEKRSQTPEGKTWAGRITEVDSMFREALQQLVAQLQWTGGAELEFIRNDRGALNLIDWNPRFPAWIYGATLAGHNLPAQLVQAASSTKAIETPLTSQEFVRVVLEIPTRIGYPLPPGSSQHLPHGLASKHPSGMPLLAKHFRRQGLNDRHYPKIPETIVDDLTEAEIWTIRTPHRIFLPKTAQLVFERVRSVKERSPHVTVDIAYSVKTNPSPILMTLAANNGMLAETITALEVEHAVSWGFSSDRIVVNGPAQFWPSEVLARRPFRAVFADSLERLAHLVQETNLAQFVGVRLKPPAVLSRFGIDVQEPETYSSLVNLLRKSGGSQDLGIQFHISSDSIGTRRWWEMYESMLHWAQAIETSSGRTVKCIDIGGGWFPEDFVEEFSVRFPKVIEQAREVLPGIQAFLLEPGKALAQPSMALLTRVLEVRRSQRRSEVVVDTATSELPMAPVFPHRLLALDRDGSSSPIPSGEDRIVGRNCMESDIIAEQVAIPPWLVAGDLIAICDAGGYDASMAYDFGRGEIHDV